MMRRTNSPRTCYCGRRSMPSSPMYVAWMCSTRVSPAAMEFTASFMMATALDTAWRSLLVMISTAVGIRRFQLGPAVRR